MIFGNKNLSAVLETYMGTPKQFLFVEKQLKGIIDLIKKDQKENEVFNSRVDLDKSDYNNAIQKTFRDFFNLRGIRIHWTEGMPNAYTRITGMPILFIDNKKNLDMNEAYVNDNMSIYVFIDTTLVTIHDLNEKELMGVLLHEIGHNFDTSPAYFFMMLPLLATSPIAWAISGFLQQLISEIGIGIDNIFRKYLPVLYNIGSGLNKFLYHISGPLMANPAALINAIQNFNPLQVVFGYGMERFADSFAATYGYGQYQASALEKMTRAENKGYNKVVRNIPIINVLDDFAGIMLDVAYSFVDPHPATQVRMKNMLNKLNRDLNDNDVPDDLKKDLQSNIKLYQDYYDNYLTNPTDEKKQVLTAWLKRINENVFKGKMDYREVFNGMHEHNEA